MNISISKTAALLFVLLSFSGLSLAQGVLYTPPPITFAGDLSGNPTSQSVKGLFGVPFCTGFTPTNGQVVEYTTGGSPSPCYAAVTATGTPGSPTLSFQFDNGGAFGGITPSATQGIFIPERVNTSGSTATPTENQVGDCSSPSTVTGSQTTLNSGSGVLWSDVVGCTVRHDIAATASATITIPTPTTLANAHSFFWYENDSAHSDTLSPTTYQISEGNSAAASTLTVPSQVSCKVALDPTNASTWKADCHPITTSAGGTGTVTHTAGALTAKQLMIGNGGADSTVDPDAETDGSGNLTAASLNSNSNVSIAGLNPWIDVTNPAYGAKGDAVINVTGGTSTTSGTTTVTTTSGATTWTSGDVGKLIALTGGGLAAPTVGTVTLASGSLTTGSSTLNKACFVITAIQDNQTLPITTTGPSINGESLPTTEICETLSSQEIKFTPTAPTNATGIRVYFADENGTYAEVSQIIPGVANSGMCTQSTQNVTDGACNTGVQITINAYTYVGFPPPSIAGWLSTIKTFNSSRSIAIKDQIPSDISGNSTQIAWGTSNDAAFASALAACPNYGATSTAATSGCVIRFPEVNPSTAPSGRYAFQNGLGAITQTFKLTTGGEMDYELNSGGFTGTYHVGGVIAVMGRAYGLQVGNSTNNVDGSQIEWANFQDLGQVAYGGLFIRGHDSTTTDHIYVTNSVFSDFASGPCVALAITQINEFLNVKGNCLSGVWGEDFVSNNKFFLTDFDGISNTTGAGITTGTAWCGLFASNPATSATTGNNQVGMGSCRDFYQGDFRAKNSSALQISQTKAENINLTGGATCSGGTGSACYGTYFQVDDATNSGRAYGNTSVGGVITRFASLVNFETNTFQNRMVDFGLATVISGTVCTDNGTNNDLMLGSSVIGVTGNNCVNRFNNSLALGETGQTTASSLTLYGSTASSNLAPPSINLENEAGNIGAWLYSSTSFNGQIGIASSAPTTDVAAGSVLYSPGGVSLVYTTGTGSTTGLLQCPVSGTSSEVTDCGSNATNFYGVSEGTGNSNTRLKSYGVVTVNIPSSVTANGDYICSGTLSAGTYNAVDNGSTPCPANQFVGYATAKNSSAVTSVKVQEVLANGAAVSGGSGTINNAAQYDVPYYTGSGTTNTLSGAAISGFQYDSASGAPAAATAANLGALLNIAQYDLLASGGTSSAPVGIPPSSTSGAPLLSQGSSANPAYGALNLAGGSGIVTGTLPLANMTQVPFDSQTNDLTTPTGNGSFTFPNTATSGFTLSGTAPASVSTSTGTNAMPLLTINGVTGGATSNATGTGGVGSAPTISGGTGGAGTGTNAVGGAGGSITIATGAGGASLGTGANANGGNLVLNLGAAGSGGSGTAGHAGEVLIGGASAITPGTATAVNLGACGTAPTGVASTSSFYCNSSNLLDLMTGTSDLGAAVAESSVLSANAIPKAIGTNPGLSASSLLDNGTTLVTTEPLVTTNTSVLTAAGTTTSTTFAALTTNSLVMATVPISTTRAGRCVIIWQTSATADTPTFALNTNNALTGLWINGSQYFQSTSALTNLLPIAVVTTATQTAFTAALTAAAATTSYEVVTDFTVQTNGTNTETITLYAKINAGTLTVEPGSTCYWLP